MTESALARFEARVMRRLDALEEKIDAVARRRNKSMEWIATLSEQIASLDAFREEVRATFEPLTGKLQGMDEVVRILRHATSDVSRRVESLERQVG